MTLLSKISIRLLFIIFVSVSIFSLGAKNVYGAIGDPCQVSSECSSQAREQCIDANATFNFRHCDVILPTGTGETQFASMFPWFQPSKPQADIDVADTIVAKTTNSALTGHDLGNATLFWINRSIGGWDEQAAQTLVAAGYSVQPGAIQHLAGGIATMTSQQPVNTATYLADLGKQAGIYNPVYAQGTGFLALDPVLKIWKAFRNMAYLAFVIIFVVIGFMIMFRSKVSQQAVISIQLALPQIIITLLLITFSYAIASLMIDLIYFLIYLLIGAASSFGILSDEGEAAKGLFFGSNLLGIAFQSSWAGNAARAVNQAVRELFNESIAGAGLGFIANGIAYLIFAIAILISLFKLFFQLLMSYVGIIVSTIFAPILLLFNAMPGSQSFQKWLKGIFANALVFPVTAMMILIASALVGERAKWGVAEGIGYTGDDSVYNRASLPLIGAGITADTLGALIGIGFLMMMPKVVELVQKALGVEGGLGGMMGAIMEPIGSAWGKTGGAVLGLGGGIARAYGGSLIGEAGRQGYTDLRKRWGNRRLGNVDEKHQDDPAADAITASGGHPKTTSTRNAAEVKEAP